jgi:uncharacterized protein
MTVLRTLKFPPTSCFVLGPRMTGKTTLLRAEKCKAFYDLLDPVQELAYSRNPGRFGQEIEALPPGSTVILDEIQKMPSLLNYVQIGIDRYMHRFILSGSSARKLKRGGANLLGGRALDLRLHPFTSTELGADFDLDQALHFGTLPHVAMCLREQSEEIARRYLMSYVTTYLKEEIQAEALTRKLGAFQRFLAVAAQGNGQMMEYANIARECSVPASTVKEYFQILEDTLIGNFLWPHDRSERLKARPKFYLFDCGVLRSIQNRLYDPATPFEKGFLFETWFINELRRIRDYSSRQHEFSLWRERDMEIDLLVSGGRGPLAAFECKSGQAELKPAVIERFRQAFPATPLIVASLVDERPRVHHGVRVLPWRDALEYYRNEL